MNINEVIKEYVDAYETRGDEGDYQPTEHERFLINDAVAGLIEEVDFKAAMRELDDGQETRNAIWDGIAAKDSLLTHAKQFAEGDYQSAAKCDSEARGAQPENPVS